MKIKVEHVPVDLHGTQYRMCRFFKKLFTLFWNLRIPLQIDAVITIRALDSMNHLTV